MFGGGRGMHYPGEPIKGFFDIEHVVFQLDMYAKSVAKKEL